MATIPSLLFCKIYKVFLIWIPAYFHSFIVDLPVKVAQLWKINLYGSFGLRRPGMDSFILRMNLSELSW